jgi:transcriptional regulator with XRE-family HTH domain
MTEKIRPYFQYVDYKKKCASNLFHIRTVILKKTQEQFVKPLDVSLTVYNGYETAKVVPPLEFLDQASKHYKLDISKFIPDTKDVDYLVKKLYESKYLLSYFITLIDEVSPIGTDLISPRVLERIQKL